MKTLLRVLCCTAILAVSVLAPSRGDDPAGSCRIRCDDGSTYQFCTVTYPRCRTEMNNLCGGIGIYAWQDGGC
jgi:hypothetical protein